MFSIFFKKIMVYSLGSGILGLDFSRQNGQLLLLLFVVHCVLRILISNVLQSYLYYDHMIFICVHLFFFYLFAIFFFPGEGFFQNEKRKVWGLI